MKKYYKCFALAAIALGFAACTQDDDFALQQEDIVQIASANIATEVQTRVNTLGDGTQWENNDRILLVNNSRTDKNSGTYTATVTTDETPVTSWSLTDGMVLYASSGTNDFTAYYPASVDFILPTDQSDEAKIKSADRMTATATAAKGTAVALLFEHRNAKVTITPAMAMQYTDVTVGELTIAGINPYQSGTAYTAILVPTTEGFTVTVKVGETTLTATTNQQLEAGNHYTFDLKVGKNKLDLDNVGIADWNSVATVDDGEAKEVHCLTFTADAEQTLIVSKFQQYTLHESLQYSVGFGQWTPLTVHTPITFGGDHGTLRMRGKSAGGMAEDNMKYAQINFGNSEVPVACSGDIRTLVDYENHTTADMSRARFYRLFANCVGLTEAPVLPATTLADNCYFQMFLYCTGLTKAPELPATTLADNCYQEMFYGCTSLTEAPELPAITLAEFCYQAMFQNCTGLTKASTLPATTLADNCYQEMFYGCTSLTEAPTLPATTLASYCYREMFYGCMGLTEAPTLPATTLADNCYREMFYGCMGLTEAPELPATTLASYCYQEMFYGCTGLTEAPAELPATTLAESCYQAMFQDCTGLTKAPTLPATTLKNSCYRQMFSGCTGLTEAPALSATTLAESCYQSMFFGCTDLANAPALPATTLAKSCYQAMFQCCTNLSSVTMLATDISASDCLEYWLSLVANAGTFTKAVGMEVSAFSRDSSGIPQGWTVVDYVEQEN